MPRTKFQGIVFGLLMSVTMAYGMEVYNVALKEGGLSQMTNQVFREALLETAYMWILVFLLSNLWGNRIGHLLAGKICREEDNPFLHTVFISSCTVLIMCPTMSAVAAVLFSVILGGGSWSQLPAYWVGTLLRNFPMALLWNLFAAGPLTRLIFRRCFAHQLAEA
jgi:phosphotransferase system  glucose/maltose/N-acetylglucosamine-specific IIC component